MSVKGVVCDYFARRDLPWPIITGVAWAWVVGGGCSGFATGVSGFGRGCVGGGLGGIVFTSIGDIGGIVSIGMGRRIASVGVGSVGFASGVGISARDLGVNIFHIYVFDVVFTGGDTGIHPEFVEQWATRPVFIDLGLVIFAI